MSSDDYVSENVLSYVDKIIRIDVTLTLRKGCSRRDRGMSLTRVGKRGCARGVMAPTALHCNEIGVVSKRGRMVDLNGRMRNVTCCLPCGPLLTTRRGK